MTIVQQDILTQALPGMARYLVGRKVDGKWGTYWSCFSNLHKYPDACLLGALPNRYQQGAWIETRIPLTSIEVVTDHMRILAQDGKEGGGYTTTGYVSGAAFKRAYLGEIGKNPTVSDAAPAEAPDGTLHDHLIQDPYFWAVTNETLQFRVNWTGGAPADQLEFRWYFTSGANYCKVVSGQDEQTVTVEFQGSGGLTALLSCDITHKWNTSLNMQRGRVYLLGVNDYPWVKAIHEQVDIDAAIADV